MDLDDINIPGVLFGLLGAGIAIIIAQKMGSPVPFRLIIAGVVGVVCYFVGGKIAEG
jgi:hypothetical protein